MKVSLTFSVCGTADDIGELGFEARIRGAVLAGSFEAARAERHHALQGRVGPQALALVDCKSCGVVNQQASVLCATTEEKPCQRLHLQACQRCFKTIGQRNK